jgi:hypothetical protein
LRWATAEAGAEAQDQPEKERGEKEGDGQGAAAFDGNPKVSPDDEWGRVHYQIQAEKMRDGGLTARLADELPAYALTAAVLARSGGYDQSAGRRLVDDYAPDQSGQAGGNEPDHGRQFPGATRAEVGQPVADHQARAKVAAPSIGQPQGRRLTETYQPDQSKTPGASIQSKQAQQPAGRSLGNTYTTEAAKEAVRTAPKPRTKGLENTL